MNGERKGPPPQLEERKVIITGTAEAQWKVSIYTLILGVVTDIRN